MKVIKGGLTLETFTNNTGASNVQHVTMCTMIAKLASKHFSTSSLP